MFFSMWMYFCPTSARPRKPQAQKTWNMQSGSFLLVPLLVVKMGRQGAIAQRGAKIHKPARRWLPVDPVGAGDSFDADSPTSTFMAPISQPALPPAIWQEHYPQRVPEERKHFAMLNTGRPLSLAESFTER